MATTKSAYYRVVAAAAKDNNTVPVPVDDEFATKQIAGREAYVPSPHVIEEANFRVSAARKIFDKDDVTAATATTPKFQTTSWRVSDDEFIIKMDASPLHMSAAQRMFDQQKRLLNEKKILEQQQQQQPQQQQPDAIQEEEEGEASRQQPEGESKRHENEFKRFWGKMLKIYDVGGGSGGGGSSSSSK